MSLIFVGDIHGNDRALQMIYNDVCNDPDVAAIIQVGDFGLTHHFNTIKPKIPIFFIDGNHEWFGDLRKDPAVPKKLLDKVTELAPNIFYVPRGTVLELDGKRIGFLGGAASIDKGYRTPEKDWFVDENITPEQEALADKMENIDILVTHAPPDSIIRDNFDTRDKLMYGVSESWQDPNLLIVDRIWNKLGNPLNICGHMHRAVFDRNCRILDINEYIVYEEIK